MLMHHLAGGAPERSPARQHRPERSAEGVEIRTDIHSDSRELLRTGKVRRPDEGSRRLKSRFPSLVH